MFADAKSVVGEFGLVSLKETLYFFGKLLYGKRLALNFIVSDRIDEIAGADD